MEHEAENELIADLRTVLEFVERWNKMDAERGVAAAAGRLSERFRIPE